MNLDKIKNLLLNKNLVIMLALFAGIIVLWFIYNSTLNRNISPKRVPVANRLLTEGTLITQDDISYIEVNNKFVKESNIISVAGRIVGRYVANGTSIPEGALFYNEQVVDKADLRERDLEDTPDGYTLYFLKVDLASTYANSIYPGDRIDLWLKGTDSGTMFYQPFITSIEVLRVKDATRAHNVFDGTGKWQPGYLVFAVSIEMYQMLANIEKLGSVQLVPIPKNKQYTDLQAPTEYVNDALKDFINQKVWFTAE